MDNYRQMAIFAAVIRAGSMSAAARQLGMTPSAISQTISGIEREAGVRLLNRSTRKLSLTDIGQRYLQSCERLVQAADDARHELTAASSAPTGLLRISAPLGLGAHVPAIFGSWLEEHGSLRLWLEHSDAYTDLIDGQIDIAIRYGNPPPGNWYARRIGTLRQLPCAAPGWLARQPPPTHPRHIPPEAWICQSTRPEGQQVAGGQTLIGPEGESFALPQAARLTSNSQPTCYNLCRADMGVAVLADLDTAADRAAGRLQRILPNWEGAPLPVWALASRHDMQPAKVTQALDRLKAYFAPQPSP